ncbi:hypothetical protein E6B08_17545 [Pseudomonas putida]|uniref:Uncharacterized protein n=1 Tax=Pseudomonas putida TaxID=303 RepID=A0A4D6XB98_PSEPU|nr:hypothetical protein [Pseudomonas putida]NWC84254.1 hypothetical protein [Pseudomonas putida]QCI13063.1 hypothetical protein E6B08_17545 [Pseudomonas putida]
MEYLEYKAAESAKTADIRRMRATLVQAGYMASENDVERLWDDYSFAFRMRPSWAALPDDDGELLKILLIGFGVNAVPYDIDSDCFHSWPSHW